MVSKPESRQCNEKADNLRPKSGDLAGLKSFDKTTQLEFKILNVLNLEDI